MTNCAPHRPYLAAVADGELECVPVETVQHLRSCESCREEVDVHRSLDAKLLASSRGQEPAIAGRRSPKRRLAMSAGGVAAITVVASIAALALDLGRPDPVLAAASAGTQAPQFQSTDGTRIEAWCTRASGGPMPELDMAPLAPVGARLDRGGTTGMVTVFYTAPGGGSVAISWLDTSRIPLGSRSVTAREVAGHLVLKAASPHGTAVISGGAPAEILWQTAARIEDAPST